MIRVRFFNGNVLIGRTVWNSASLSIEKGTIVAISPECGGRDDAIDLAGGWIVPGFIDTQVNGGGGVLFNDDPSLDAIATIAAAHRAYGTTGFLPTIITDSPEIIARALHAVDQAIASGMANIVGVHVEGPAINAARRGIHRADYIRPFDDELMALLCAPRQGRVMVTLAPECVSPTTIAALVRAGVLVSLGHSDAPYEIARAAFEAGATGVTHLYNAMSPLTHRAPGLVGAALDNQTAYCGIIVDGHHVDDAALRIALRARPHDRFMLVSDAMPCVGSLEPTFDLQGQPIRVHEGRCVGVDGTLAGAALDMASALRNAVTRLGLEPAKAFAMASANPAAFLGLTWERGTLAPGLRADWVQLDADLRPVTTTIGGETA